MLTIKTLINGNLRSTLFKILDFTEKKVLLE